MNTMSLFTELLATVSATPMLAAATAAVAAAPEKVAPSGLQLVYEFLATGGFVMALLVVCSMCAIGASIMAWLQLRAQVIMPSAVVSQLRSIPSYALKGDIRPLQEFLSHDGSMLSRLGSMAISGAFTSKQECHDACAIKAREEIHRLESGIPLLEVMVTVAPLLGLLGTVTGIIKAFNAISVGGMGDPRLLSGGISEALVTTAAGLCVAIPSLIGYRYLRGRVDRIVVQMEKDATIFSDALEARAERQARA